MNSDAEIALQNIFDRDALDAGIDGGSKNVRPKILTRKTRRYHGGSSDGDIVTAMMTIRDQVKLYHWQTYMFSRHTATDELVKKLDANVDTFVETYMGKYGRPRVSMPIKLNNFSESAARSFVERQRKFLSVILPRKLSANDTDLLNIRDTILGDLNQTLYLFTLS
jgi:hypothetical protein